MPMNDIFSGIKGSASIAAATISSSTTGSEVDISDLGDVCVIGLYVSAAGTADASNYFTLSATQATATGGTFGAANTLVGLHGWDLIINATTETGWYFAAFEPTAGYNFVKAVMTETSTASITCSAHFFFSKRNQPTT